MGSRGRFSLAGVVPAIAVALAILLAPGAAGTGSSTNTVVYALDSVTPNYIFPISDTAHLTVTNSDLFQDLMWRSLYVYEPGAARPSARLSLAGPPVFSDGNRKVTVTLKPYRWSDGKPVTARDVAFAVNVANGAEHSTIARIHDTEHTISSVQVVSSRTFTLTLSRSYSPTWYTRNRLAGLTPLPQHAWDRTSATGPAGDFDQTSAGATAVYEFLARSAARLGTYASNPLWKVVDGPWRLASFKRGREVQLVPNRQYSGPQKPRIARLIMRAYSTYGAEIRALAAGQVDYGFAAAAQLPPRARSVAIKGRQYVVRPWVVTRTSYMPINFTRPQTKAALHQLYVRQALQLVVDQRSIIRRFLDAGWPTHGPVPAYPASPYVSALGRRGAYGYQPTRAAELLRRHGWVVRHGVRTCESPGTGAGHCGAGIRRGATLDLRLIVEFNSGDIARAWKAAAAGIGVRVRLTVMPFNAVFRNAQPCRAGRPCPWDMAYWGSNDYGSLLPLTEAFRCGVSNNVGGYCDPRNDAYTLAVKFQPGRATLFRWQDYLARQLPALWMPTGPRQISVIRADLKGVVQTPDVRLAPEDWHWAR